MVKELDETIFSVSPGSRAVLYFLLPLPEVSILTWSTENKNEVEKKKKRLLFPMHFFCVYIDILPPFCLSLPLSPSLSLSLSYKHVLLSLSRHPSVFLTSPRKQQDDSSLASVLSHLNHFQIFPLQSFIR